VRTYVPVTSQGSPYGRFRRAVDHGNALQALSAAAELRTVALSDALELVLLLARKDSGQFRRGCAALARALLPRTEGARPV